MAAWASAPVFEGDSIRFRETFRKCDGCIRECPPDPEEARIAKIRQEVNRCVHLPVAKWRDATSFEERFVDFAYMGGEDEGVAETNDDGCPGGWYRTAFCYSLFRYLRPHAEGVYSASPYLDRCNDRLVLDAVQYYEVEQGRARAHANEIIDDHLKAK